jgi:hypothetical protein
MKRIGILMILALLAFGPAPVTSRGALRKK